MDIIIMFFIKIYQRLFSFDHAFWADSNKFRICRFYPSCSEYSFQSYKKYGTIKGTFLTIMRIFRCNPFSKGGYDPVK